MLSEKIFTDLAKDRMIDIERFKKVYPHIYFAIIDSMEKYSSIKLEEFKLNNKEK